MNNFNFLYDKTSSNLLQNAIFIVSTMIPVQQLLKEISKNSIFIIVLDLMKKAKN